VLLIIFRKVIGARNKIISSFGIVLIIGVSGFLIYIILAVVVKTSSVDEVNNWTI
jgi:hypothetical protein